jgi:peptide/nickel transport system permease protein
VTTYIVRRLIMALTVLILVGIIVFFIMHLLPGDPLLLYLGANVEISDLSPEKIAELRHGFGLDQPLIIQYLSWVNGILHGDLGTSMFYHEKVGTLLLERYPITIYLGLMAFIGSAVIGILLGLISGLRRGTWLDALATVFAYLGLAVPIFWLGILMIYVFGFKFNLLPISGYTSPLTDLGMSLEQSIMPVICLAVSGLAATARQARSSIIEVIHQDYIRTAWSKGLKESYIIYKHAMKNSLIPVITLIGINVRNIFGGSVIIETIFAIPGVGLLLVNSIFGHDYTVVQSITLVMAVVILAANLVVDLAYGWLDPRIRYT